MSCEKYQKMISDKLDENLSNRQSDELLRHLEKCNDCRAFSERLGRAGEVFKAANSAPPEAAQFPYLATRIAARMAEEHEEKRPRRIRLAAAFATLALIAALSIGYYARPYLGIDQEKDASVVSSITIKSSGVGVEIEENKFVLHSKDKKGKSAIDLKL